LIRELLFPYHTFILLSRNTFMSARVTQKHLDFLESCEVLLASSKKLRKKLDLQLDNGTKGDTTMTDDSIMDKKREAIWSKTFKLCGVNMHPIKLTKSKREHQRLLLEALHAESEGLGTLPASRKFGIWWVWYNSDDSKDSVK